MLNRVILVGRMTRDPELRFTPNGVATCSFTLAVNRPFKNQAGEQEADFINVVVWRKPAENTANYCRKGSLVGVDGRIQTRSYDTDNGRRYVTEVVADSVHFLDTRNNQNSNHTSQSNGNNTNYTLQNTNVDNDPFKDTGIPMDISDDNLPF